MGDYVGGRALSRCGYNFNVLQADFSKHDGLASAVRFLASHSPSEVQSSRRQKRGDCR